MKNKKVYPDGQSLMTIARIQIREHVMSDFDAYFEWQSDPQVAQHLSWLPRNREESEACLLDAIAQQNADPRLRYFFAVVLPHNNEMVGDVGFTLATPVEADCGWFIRRRYWGRGYATEGVRQLIRYAFENTDLIQLCASCAVENRSSIRVMEKCGFKMLKKSKSRTQFMLTKKEWAL